MVLLLLNGVIKDTMVILKFKFHYGATSTSTKRVYKYFSYEFKFHYGATSTGSCSCANS